MAAANQTDYTNQFAGNITANVRDMEDKQRVMKDRLFLIGQNLIEIKEKTNQQILQIKKDIETMRDSLERLSSFVETISNEISKYAKKDDLEILAKQAKMFQPMDFVRKEDLEKLRR